MRREEEGKGERYSGDMEEDCEKDKYSTEEGRDRDADVERLLEGGEE